MLTGQLLIEIVNLSVSIVDDLVDLDTKIAVLVRECPGKVFLVNSTTCQS